MKKSILSAVLLFIMAIAAQAQNITVHGTVVSKTDDEPLIGASVVPDGNAGAGVATDIDGNFTLSVPQGTGLTVHMWDSDLRQSRLPHSYRLYLKKMPRYSTKW